MNVKNFREGDSDIPIRLYHQMPQYKFNLTNLLSINLSISISVVRQRNRPIPIGGRSLPVLSASSFIEVISCPTSKNTISV